MQTIFLERIRDAGDSKAGEFKETRRSLVSVRSARASHRHARTFYPCLESATDIKKLKQTLKQHGVQITEGEPLEGAARFYVNDPFGNRLEFLQRH